MLLAETVLHNPWIPSSPTPRQADFLGYFGREALYGGAGGGGKSEALLMAAAQFVMVPGYAALLLRRTYSDLALPGALMDRAQGWWHDRAKWDGQEHRWRFPSGATIQFGYLDQVQAHQRYRSSEFQFIGFDELTEFEEPQYRFLFSRLRKPARSELPLRMRSATNPGGRGHAWVKARFVKAEPSEQRLFFPAKLRDNPHIDRDAYEESLSQLDPVTRAQIRDGDWDAVADGRFKSSWFANRYLTWGDGWRLGPHRWVGLGECVLFATVDPAASVKNSADWTVASVWAVTPTHELLWLDCVRVRLEVPDIVPMLEKLWEKWSPAFVAIESGGTQQGVYQAARRTKMVCKPMVRSKGQDKLVRATRAILLAEGGRIWLPASAPWLDAVEEELYLFTGDDKKDAHDDVVDTLSDAAELLEAKGYWGRKKSIPRVLGGR